MQVKESLKELMSFVLKYQIKDRERILGIKYPFFSWTNKNNNSSSYRVYVFYTWQFILFIGLFPNLKVKFFQSIYK